MQIEKTFDSIRALDRRIRAKETPFEGVTGVAFVIRETHLDVMLSSPHPHGDRGIVARRRLDWEDIEKFEPNDMDLVEFCVTLMTAELSARVEEEKSKNG